MRSRKKLSGLDKYVIFSISSLIVYTIITQIMVFMNLMVNDTLTTVFFGFFGGECVTCAVIKIFKLREEPKTNDNEIPEKDGAIG